ncbi:COG2192 Predicted carbamoyl transferase, NodU family [Burkholderiales bacterium]|jgi:carbamoyltransferase
MTAIIGINAFHGDASACLVVDGQLVAAIEEERITRHKHSAGFPTGAIKACLETANLTLDAIDYIAINRDHKQNIFKKLLYILGNPQILKFAAIRLDNLKKILSTRTVLINNFGLSRFPGKVVSVEHHHAHLASAFYVSPFQSAAVVSVDGFGDFVSTKWAVGNRSGIRGIGEVRFPHSLGIFYTAVTQYLGFPNYGDEYKVMGLAPYGLPMYIGKMREVVHLTPNGRFELNLRFFTHHLSGVPMTWVSGEPVIGSVFSQELETLFGPKRRPSDPITQYHKDIAASAQAMYEQAFFHLLNHVQQHSGQNNLALAGGCAMNSVANGKIFKKTNFKEIYIQSAAGDAGGAIGAAFAVWHDKLSRAERFEMGHAYWGPHFSNDYIKVVLHLAKEELRDSNCLVERIEDEHLLYQNTAKAISRGLVIGWFQGRMEWGPRALGNRSILGDPRRADMKDILNLKIKRRESFRPFAPSILREHVRDWFETDYDVPFMMQVYQILEHKRAQIPAVTHVNGSGRLQTVTLDQNKRYYKLISAFNDLTNIPMLLNTSFNENEPVVCKPEEALNCFLRTKMDILVMGDYFIQRAPIQ